MPIVAGDIEYRLSGGAANSDVNASIGGAKSSVEVVTATLHNLFDAVSAAEAEAGEAEYRCIYVQNNHGSLTLNAAKIWIETQTPSADSIIAIALGGEGVNGTAEAPANENTAPSGETFSAPSNYAGGLSLGNLAPGDFYPVWIRRTISASAAPAAADSVVLRVQGETAA